MDFQTDRTISVLRWTNKSKFIHKTVRGTSYRQPEMLSDGPLNSEGAVPTLILINLIGTHSNEWLWLCCVKAKLWKKQGKQIYYSWAGIQMGFSLSVNLFIWPSRESKTRWTNSVQRQKKKEANIASLKKWVWWRFRGLYILLSIDFKILLLDTLVQVNSEGVSSFYLFMAFPEFMRSTWQLNPKTAGFSVKQYIEMKLYSSFSLLPPLCCLLVCFRVI